MVNVIEDLVAQSSVALHRAGSAATAEEKDELVMRSERLLDQAWHLNEADAALPPLESGLWH